MKVQKVERKINVHSVRPVQYDVSVENTAPCISSSNTWMVYDYQKDQFIDTGVKATGPQGIQGIQGIPGADGKDGSDAEVTSQNIQYALGYTPAKQQDLNTKANVGDSYTKSESDAKYLTTHQDISGKVDKVTGKGLSTNDYSNAAKAKVDAIPDNPKYTDTVYDDTEIKASITAQSAKNVEQDTAIDGLKEEIAQLGLSVVNGIVIDSWEE